MPKQELNDSSATFMIASIQEAHNYLRDTSKRMTDHIQFYLTISTALLAGLFVMINSQASLTQLPISIALLCIIQSGIGFMTFARLLSIKVQATNHFARANRWGQYFIENDKHLQNYFAGEGMLRENSIRMRHFPLTRQIILLLRAFALFNGLVLSTGLLFATRAILHFSNIMAWQPSTSYIVGYGLIYILVVGATFVLSNAYLNSQVRGARGDFVHILGDEIGSSDTDTSLKKSTSG